ncbi:flavin reductase like domain-containing protein [Phaeosphaeria sp. MPI-PUGE-AT-0046c]|nr:flavin reductase like domain-containing protein [Phaeosphaeria sp. MPI-PUGE-AT-0046c]
MTLSQRPASHFFAAFYRYSRIAHRPRVCVHSASLAQHGRQLPVLLHPRQLHTSRFLRQQEQPQRGHAKDVKPAAPADTSPREAIGSGAASEQTDGLDADAERLKHNVRQLMRKVPTSVAVVTVLSYDAELKMHVPMGVAVSSFTTVSLDPPTVSFNIKQPSKTLDAIRAAKGLFRVHFPVADKGGATMVDVFSRGNHANAYITRTKALGLYVPGHGSAMDRRRATASQAPQISGDYVRAAMECTLTQELPVADHVILVARVDSLESRRPNDNTILYVDGSYMVPNGSNVNTSKELTTNFDSTWYSWEHPLVPSEEGRLTYKDQIRSVIKTRINLQTTSKEIRRHLDATLPLSPAAWGINIDQLVDECRREAGHPSELPPHLQDSSVLSDFYGRLNQADRAKIIDRAKKLVIANPEVVALNWRKFLQYLEVSTSSRDLLPSDIAGPLRAEGLLGPFQPRVGDFQEESSGWSLQYLEQVEHNLVEHFATIGYEKALIGRFEDVVKSLGENQAIGSYFQKSRFRLLAAAAPKLFSPANFDISGDISQEEARVVVSRFIKFSHLENLAAFRKNISMNYQETLRFLRIHPCIAGFSVEFLVGKIKHLYFTTRYSRDVVALIHEMLEPWFARITTWEDLEGRVKEFVRKMPQQAMSWSTRDKLAAMGLDWEAVLDVPSSNNKQPLNDGHVLDTLIAKELKGLYVNSSDELSQAIALYLKRQYNFDVDPSHALSSAQSVDGAHSSSDDMEEAMMASRQMGHAGLRHARSKRVDLASDGERVDRPRIRGFADRKPPVKKSPRWHKLQEKGEAKRAEKAAEAQSE